MTAASECGVRLGQHILHLLRVSAAYPGLVEHVGHLVDSVQQHVHLALHVLPLPLALLDRVLEHLEVARLPHHLRLHLLLVLLHAYNLGLQRQGPGQRDGVKEFATQWQYIYLTPCNQLSRAPNSGHNNINANATRCTQNVREP